MFRTATLLAAFAAAASGSNPACAQSAASHHILSGLPAALRPSGPAADLLAGAKTTASSSRLIGKANLVWNPGTASYEFDDSIAYRYSSGRGGDYDNTELADEQTDYWHDGAGYRNNHRTLRTFNAWHGFLTNSFQSWNNGTSSWDNNQQTLATYDGSGHLASTVRQSWSAGNWNNMNREQMSYTDGLETETVYQKWDLSTAAWLNENRLLNTYDGAGRLTQQVGEKWVSGAWQTFSRGSYTYNSAGKATSLTGELWNAGSATWQPAEKYMLEYDASGTLQTKYLIQTWDAGAWKNVGQYLFTYTGSIATETVAQVWVAASSSWRNTGRSLATVDGEGNILTEVSQDWITASSSWENDYRRTYTYNSFGQRTTYLMEDWDVASATYEPNISYPYERYHYETYTGIEGKGGVTPAGSLELYPVPATAALHAQVKWGVASPATLTVVDAAGREIFRQVSSGRLAEHRFAVPATHLPAGTYAVRIAGDGGAVTETVQIVH